MKSNRQKKQYKWYRITRPDGTTFDHPSTLEYMEKVFTKGGYSYMEITTPCENKEEATITWFNVVYQDGAFGPKGLFSSHLSRRRAEMAIEDARQDSYWRLFEFSVHCTDKKPKGIDDIVIAEPVQILDLLDFDDDLTLELDTYAYPRGH